MPPKEGMIGPARKHGEGGQESHPLHACSRIRLDDTPHIPERNVTAWLTVQFKLLVAQAGG